MAKEKKAAIIDGGDLFCMMGGKYDKRSSKEGIRAEHQVDNYIDTVIHTASEFFEPYAHNFVLIATGNHESSIAKMLESHPIDRLVSQMNISTGSKVNNGGYSGWVIFRFMFQGRSICSIKLHYDHGSGATDAIQNQKRAVYLPDADIVVSHHTHDSWYKELGRQRITPHGKTYHDVQTHVKVPTYKEEYQDGYSGWHVQRGSPPKPLGAYWIRFYFDGLSEMVHYELIRAK